jgi:hypothetical protein
MRTKTAGGEFPLVVFLFQQKPLLTLSHNGCDMI